MFHDAPAALGVALAHFLDERDHFGVVDDLRNREARGGVDVEVEGAGRGVVGEHQLVECVGDQHRVGNAVDDGLGVLPFGGGDAELNIQLFYAQLSTGNRALGVLD